MKNEDRLGCDIEVAQLLIIQADNNNLFANVISTGTFIANIRLYKT